MNMERRVQKLERHIALIQGAGSRIFIITFVAAKQEGLSDYPDCPGLEAQRDAVRKNNQPFIMCQSDCSRKCQEGEETYL